MSYFKQFPKVPYDLLGTGAIQNVVDLHRSVRPVSQYLDSITEYAFHTIPDGARPDIVSLKLYKNPEYYWTFFIINDFLADGLPAWPLSEQQLAAYIAENYSAQVIVTKPVVNTDSFGNVVDFQDNINAVSPNDTTSFLVGETVQNDVIDGTPTATGTITQINVDMNQLVIKPITGAFTASDVVVGLASGRNVRAYKLYAEAVAPFYYYRSDDMVNMRPATCPELYGVIDGTNTINDMPIVTNRQHIIAQNDSRSQMRIISPEYIEAFAAEYMSLINK